MATLLVSKTSDKPFAQEAKCSKHASEAGAGLQVVYEDEHMACIVKPQGMPTAQVRAAWQKTPALPVVWLESSVFQAQALNT